MSKSLKSTKSEHIHRPYTLDSTDDPVVLDSHIYYVDSTSTLLIREYLCAECGAVFATTQTSSDVRRRKASGEFNA